MRKIKITEEQRQYALKEGIVLNADVAAAGGDVRKAVDTTKQQAKDSGVDLKKAAIQMPAESKVITKKQIMEKNLRILKKNSKLYNMQEFMKRIKKGINESGLTNAQIRNITGIYDDDMLNAGAEAEQAEQLEGDIFRSIGEIAQGNPRKNTFNFSDMANMLKEKYGFNYKGIDDDAEGHIFTNGKYELYIYPDTFYANQGAMRISNLHVF